MTQNLPKIYQAPLQGFTDLAYRNLLFEVFGGIDKYFIPYLSYGKGREIKKSQLREVFPENNLAKPVIPQVLFSDLQELIDLVTILVDYGFEEINLNLGCPYPMVTNRGRGAAWLEKPDALKEVLDGLYSKGFAVKFSVKMRAGMNTNQDIYSIIPVLNQFPLEEVIFHPRMASQMYNGTADPKWFTDILSEVKHPLVYNGDILSESDFQNLQLTLPEQTSWMIGRGLLINPAFALCLKGETFEHKELRKKMKEFHDRLLETYSSRLAGGGHLLMKMYQFWTYFSESFENPHKALKLVKKAGSVPKYNAAVAEIFNNL